jgi:ComF family protein
MIFNKKHLKNFLLDLLFPKYCFNCHKPDTIFCNNCLKNIDLLSWQVCPHCEKTITPNGEMCHLCQKQNKVALNYLLVVADYQDKILAQAIHLFKYKFIKELHIPLGNLMVKYYQKTTLPIPDFIIPVPLHRRRLRWRGFNQAELLGDILSKHLLPGLNIPILNQIIIRHNYTKPQQKVKNYFARQKNMRDAFNINKNFLIKTNFSHLRGKNILLVDDLSTTGATIFNLAKELKKLQPKNIGAIVLGRR